MAFKIESSYKNNSQTIKIKGKKVVGKSSYEVGLVVEGQAKLLCPVDYGYLRASINTQSVDNGTELDKVVSRKEKVINKKGKETYKAVHKASHKSFWEDMPDGFVKITKPTDSNECYVGTAVEYGPYIEFGTFRMSAQPFLRPAGDMAQGKVLNIVEKNGKYEFGDYLNPKGATTNAESIKAWFNK